MSDRPHRLPSHRAAQVERARQARAARVQNVLSSLSGLTLGGSDPDNAPTESEHIAVSAAEPTAHADGPWPYGGGWKSKRSTAGGGGAAAAASALGVGMPIKQKVPNPAFDSKGI